MGQIWNKARWFINPPYQKLYQDGPGVLVMAVVGAKVCALNEGRRGDQSQGSLCPFCGGAGGKGREGLAAGWVESQDHYSWNQT